MSPPDDKKLKQLEDLLKLLQDGVTKEEFVTSFENCVHLITTFAEKTTSNLKDFKAELTRLGEQLQEDNGADLASLKDQALDLTDALTKDINATLDAQVQKVDRAIAGIPEVTDGYTPVKGVDYFDGAPGANGSPDTAIEVRDKLETLEGKERLKRSAIDGLDDFLAKIEKDVKAAGSRISPGRSLLQLYVSGAKKGAVQYVNFIAGTGVTLAYAYANGRNDITINASGGGGGIVRSVNSININTTAGKTAATDYVYLTSGTTTLTLPTAVANTNLYTVKNTGVATVTVATTSSQTIDGSASASLPVANTSLSFISDNTNWRII